MATKVVEANEVSINGVYYPISRPVQVVLASLYPAKITIGDTSRDSQTRASVISWADWRGGLGTERMEGAVDVDKAWWSTAQLRYKRHLVLPELAVQTAEATSYTGSASNGQIAEYGNEIYTAYAEQIFKYSNAADSWGSSLRTLASSATDNLLFKSLVNLICFSIFSLRAFIVESFALIATSSFALLSLNVAILCIVSLYIKYAPYPMPPNIANTNKKIYNLAIIIFYVLSKSL